MSRQYDKWEEGLNARELHDDVQFLEWENKKLRESLHLVAGKLLENFGRFGGSKKLNDVFEIINNALNPQTQIIEDNIPENFQS